MLTKVLYPLVGCIFHAQNVLFDVTITLNQCYWMYFFFVYQKTSKFDVFSYTLDVCYPTTVYMTYSLRSIISVCDFVLT
jgi:hypothetical protein